MQIPRFLPENINPLFLKSGIGDSFQPFVFDTLKDEYPDLHNYPSGGKDGGIDIVDRSNIRTVIECKYQTDDDFSDLLIKWNSVEERFNTHLIKPAGPTTGQSQYLPWYDQTNPIRKYVFCTSAKLANEARHTELSKTIHRCFQSLGTNYPHLSHLSQIEVKVLDWNDLESCASNRPDLVFRWFPKLRPNGIVPLDEKSKKGSFRDYLNNEKLPYYSLTKHLETNSAPIGSTIMNEAQLLQQLGQNSNNGLIIRGRGGVGKSRLMLELGRIAVKVGWSVFHVMESFRLDSLDTVIERTEKQTTVLLLIDYIETLPDFNVLMERINEINDQGTTNIFYIATCRPGYYNKAIKNTLSNYCEFDLTATTPIEETWQQSYRESAVQWILSQAALPDGEQYRTVCHDQPILAVFILYLYEKQRTQELAELHSEKEFGNWFHRRMKQISSEEKTELHLAHLLAMLPFPTQVQRKLGNERYSILVNALASDGWIERKDSELSSGEEEWVTVHDVFADSFLISFAAAQTHTFDHFLHELFEIAADTGTLTSVLTSLQRIADHLTLRNTSWSEVICHAIANKPDEWKTVRDTVLTTSLLPVDSRIEILDQFPNLWKDAEQEIIFQNRLGWFARWCTKNREEISPTRLQSLTGWLGKAIPFVTRSNYILTQALRLSPNDFKTAAYEWIIAKPALFQTHYLLVAWLESKLDYKAIANSLKSWCQTNPFKSQLSFVVRSWLDASKDFEFVREDIRIWLNEHQEQLEARFVYRSWLDASKDFEFVREDIRIWLNEHQEQLEARFVYRSWLDASNDFEFVRDNIRCWLNEYQEQLEARFVYRSWLDASNDFEFVHDNIHRWLNKHNETLEAGFVYRSWLDASKDFEFVRADVRLWLNEYNDKHEANYIFRSWLDASNDFEFVRDNIHRWLNKHNETLEAGFVYNSWLNASKDFEFVRKDVRQWLDNHADKIESEFVLKSWLDASKDFEFVRKDVRSWLNEHYEKLDAGYVYHSWLDASKDFEFVRKDVRLWLNEHKEKLEAGYVYRSWLDVCGNWDDISENVIRWLEKYCVIEDAGYLLKIIAKQKNLPEKAIRAVLAWCRTFPLNPDMLWRITQLRDNLYNKSIADEVFTTTEKLLPHYLDVSRQIQNDEVNQITSLVTFLLNINNDNKGKFTDRVEQIFIQWIFCPYSFGRFPRPFPQMEQQVIVKRFQMLLTSGQLDVVKDRSEIVRFLEWVDNWENVKKMKINYMIDQLSDKFPDPELWNIVRFE